MLSTVYQESTVWQDIWSISTAPQLAISPLLNFSYVSFHYSAAVLVHGNLPGTHGNVSATFTSERHVKVNFENLSRKWQIGLNTAKRTLEETTQRGVRTAV